MSIKTYIKLKNSIVDQSLDEKFVKLSIFEHKEHKSDIIPKFLTLNYCEIGLCNSIYKPCTKKTGFCPYMYTHKLELPYNNHSKEYDEYIKEYHLQKTLKILNEFMDDDLEKAIYGELNKEKYDILIGKLAEKLAYTIKLEDLHFHRIFADISSKIRENKEKEKEKLKAKEVVVDEIGNYIIIRMPGLPDVLDENGKSLWCHYQPFSPYGIIEKCKFDYDFWYKLNKYRPWQSWFIDRYDRNIEKINSQIEEKYGFVTAFNLAQAQTK